MPPEEVEKPIDVKPEEPKAEETATTVPPAAEAKPVEEAPATPPADPMKQMGDAAGQVGASVDKAMAGMTPQNRFVLVLVVSVFVAWVGDILNGQVMKGVAVLIAAMVLLFGGFVIPFAFLLTFPLFCLFHLIAAVDAIVIANRISKGEKFGDWDFFFKPAPTT